MAEPRTIAVIGLGYVGLPVAAAFARAGFQVIGFDIKAERIAALKRGEDATGELSASELCLPQLELTGDAHALRRANFHIVTVPTPIDEARQPDLSALKAASRTVGAALKRGDIVVYESTVYPGATQEDCMPLLEQVSGLKAAGDFAVGYSPERINPGDRTHRLETITKVVAGQDEATAREIARVYGRVVKAGIHIAPSIRVAEAAKVIENAQRDLNIAFMNELSAIFELLNIDTADVLAAARTKWNFLPFTPGLVGGHCIGVDPYYLTHRAERAGHHSDVILAGRRINDAMGGRVARMVVRLLMERPASGERARVAVLGLTFKEDVPDIRNSRVIDIVRELEAFNVEVQVADPLADPQEAEREYGLTLTPLTALQPADAVVLAVAHEAYAAGWPVIAPLVKPGGAVVDVKSVLDRAHLPDGVRLSRL